jgi:hypothetical protein
LVCCEPGFEFVANYRSQWFDFGKYFSGKNGNKWIFGLKIQPNYAETNDQNISFQENVEISPKTRDRNIDS